MTGDCEEKARPHLLFVHNDRAVYQKYRSLIKDSGLMKDYPSVTIGEKNTLKLLATGMVARVRPLAATTSDIASMISIFGNRIFVGPSSASTSPNHVATVGGIIRHGSDVFIFSAGHPFSSSPDTSESQTERPMKEGHTEKPGGAATMKTLNEAGSRQLDQVRGRFAPDLHMHALDLATASHLRLNLSKSQTAHNQPTGQIKGDEAFGLAQIQRLQRDQFAEKETNPIVSSNLDYALVRLADGGVVENLLANTPLNNRRSTGTLRRTNIIVPDSDDDAIDVFCCTASGGLLTGTLDGTLSHIRLPNSSTFHEVYEIQFDAPLAQGDCGSWVLDAGTGDLYGHIIAGCEREGIAYIMPARDVFDNVQARLNQGLLVDSDLVLETLLTSECPAFSADAAQTSTGPEEREIALQIANPTTPGVASECTQHSHAISQGQKGLHQSASELRPCVEPCRASCKMTVHSAYYGPSYEDVQRSGEVCIESDAVRTMPESDPSPQPQPQLPPESTAHVDGWPAEFKRRRNLDLAMENRPYIDVAEESRHLRDMISEFMQDPEGYGGSDPRADKVRDFCLGTSLGAIRDQQAAPYVAWLDERSFENGQCCPRAYRGPLTARELYAQLRKPRFRPRSAPEMGHDENLSKMVAPMNIKRRRMRYLRHFNPTNAMENLNETKTQKPASSFSKGVQSMEPDAERRLIFITDLDPASIYALISTVSKTQAAPLRDAIYKHLAFQAHFDASFSLGGFHGFQLVFHLPYFAWRRSSTQPRLDDRRYADGRPLRDMVDVSFLDPRQINGRDCLHEAQISCVVAGLDDHRWVAYCFVDTYFDGEDEWRESVVEYHRDRESEYGFNADPLTYGNVDADMPIRDPREYFLRVLEHRLYQVRREWLTVIDKIKEDVQRQDHDRANDITKRKLPRTFDQHEREELRRSLEWCLEFMRLSTQLRDTLGRTLAGYEKFDHQYLSSWHCGARSLDAIQTTFNELALMKSELEAVLQRCTGMVRSVSPYDYHTTLFAFLQEH
ncbi:uncharacterized protein A1O5_11594 [Cladophialophora psammophila CBS 110553]|uniref:Uncharacterized protein n=1 Tax=Cladophialophora psammophila CBS 110553 TaxID=1182543 RepID=W9W5M2_9EURO|nr:uncharacterized protein A1O5_11594 [Cladophialophora psammophila CBS 110553]EXJ63273.1 hypothetical protein A1O5_11594 [Cladophialophora psammophila CBS 110553]